MREIHVNAQKSYLTGCINKHIVNVEVLLANAVSIGEHQDVHKSIETELGHIAGYLGKLEVLGRFFVPKPQKESEEVNDKD